ncbi:MAG: transmembrane 220 family protein [Saprospiraceae bacterium]
MKIVNIILGILFALFAAVQYNDPDSWNWILLYLFVAVVSFAAAKGRYNKMVLVIAMLGMLAWMLYLLPGFINWLQSGMPTIVDEMKTTKPHIEIVREFLGLLLAMLTLGFHYYKMPKISN